MRDQCEFKIPDSTFKRAWQGFSLLEMMAVERAVTSDK
jgi:hypothetical protein